MRIIAGEFRGRQLLAPKSDATRPITDRAKQSLFDILAPLIPDATVFDLFCGTGSMGLECLSRGAEQCFFFEADKSALTQLRKNIQTLKLTDRQAILRPGDIFAKSIFPSSQAHIVFLDPPYRFLRDMPADLQSLVSRLAANHLRKDAIVIFRHDAADALDLPPLCRYDLRTYGSMAIELFQAP